MRRITFLVLVLVAIISVFSACAKEDPAKKLLGDWVCDGSIFPKEISFAKDGVAGIKDSGRSYTATWELKDGLLTVITDDLGTQKTTFDAVAYTVKGDTLTVTVDGKDVVYTKVFYEDF